MKSYKVQLNKKHLDEEKRDIQRPFYYLLFLTFVQSAAQPLDARFHIHNVEKDSLDSDRESRCSSIFYRSEIPPQATYFDKRGKSNSLLPDCTLSLEDNEHGFVLQSEFNKRGGKFVDVTFSPIAIQMEALQYGYRAPRRVFPK